jgi:hypothetical protein
MRTDIQARHIIFLGLMLCASGAAAAESDSKPNALDAVIKCRAITDPTARLACFDSATGIVADLVAHKQAQMVDSESMRQTRRSLFGFSLPRIPLFSGDKPDEVTEIDAMIASVREVNPSQIEIRLSDGAVWQTTEAPDWGAPKAGAQVHIRRGLMGNYFVTFKGQRPVRAMRIG